jgi:hypothetical protein
VPPLLLPVPLLLPRSPLLPLELPPDDDPLLLALSRNPLEPDLFPPLHATNNEARTNMPSVRTSNLPPLALACMKRFSLYFENLVRLRPYHQYDPEAHE